MKTLKFTTKIIGILIFATLIYGFVLLQQQSEEELIVGTWVEESTTIENRWVFYENGILEDYYENQISETYTWSITTTSPVCGETVPIGPNFSYLKLVNTNDPMDEFCYEILSLNDEFLQIRWIKRGGFTLYIKQ